MSKNLKMSSQSLQATFTGAAIKVIRKALHIFKWMESMPGKKARWSKITLEQKQFLVCCIKTCRQRPTLLEQNASHWQMGAVINSIHVLSQSLPNKGRPKTHHNNTTSYQNTMRVILAHVWTTMVEMYWPLVSLLPRGHLADSISNIKFNIKWKMA